MKFNLQSKKPCQRLRKKIPGLNFSAYSWMFIALFLMLCSFTVEAQNIPVKFKEPPLEKVLGEVAKQANYEVFYSQNLLKKSNPVTINVKNANLKETLNLIFTNQNLKYTITNQTIVVTAVKVENKGNGLINIQGKVLNNKNEPFPGVNVYVSGTDRQSVTDFDGSFSVSNVPSDGIIECSGLTIEKKSFAISGRTQLTLVVEEKVSVMKEVVVTGFQTLTRSHSTGAIFKVDEKILNENIKKIQMELGQINRY